MPYIRKRGRQVALVHGHRNIETGKVEQVILFTIYSRPEAEGILARPQSGIDFEWLMETTYPRITFNWKKIKMDLEAKLDLLPAAYNYRAGAVERDFSSSMHEFLRQLLANDPQELDDALDLIKKYRRRLQFVQEMIEWRIETSRRAEKSEYSRDNAFCWRRRIASATIPLDVEEIVDERYRRRDYRWLKTACELLTECYDTYAEGHNYLGLMALQRNSLRAAEKHFKRCMEAGRKNLPRGLKKDDYWNLMETRPYVRGLINIGHTYNRSRQFDKVVEVARKLDKRCGMDVHSRCLLGSVYLNTGKWKQAIRSVRPLLTMSPDESYVIAIAYLELSEIEESRDHFLHGLMNNPWFADLLLDNPIAEPAGWEEIDQYNASLNTWGVLQPYLENKTPESFGLFRAIMNDERVRDLRAEMKALLTARDRRDGRAANEAGYREARRRIDHYHSLDFAREFFRSNERSVGHTGIEEE